MLFQGLSAFPITPADAQGRVDTGALTGLLKRLTDAKVDSIGLLGSTGAYPYLSRAERRRAIDAAVDHAGGKVPIIVGIGALRTDEAVQLGRDAKAAGADAVLLAPVSYIPLNDDEVFTHFATVAEAVRLPLCIYNNPTFTHFTFGTALIARLSQVPSIVAIKNPAPDAGLLPGSHQALRAALPDGFSIGYSGDWKATAALLAGGDAWYCVAGGLFPVVCQQIIAAVRSGDRAKALALDARLQPLWDLFMAFGSLRVIYAAANLLGLSGAAPPRPILPLAEEGQARVSRTLADLNLT